MIQIKNVDVFGWEHAIRGMRNPMNSWAKSDSTFIDVFDDYEDLRSYYSKSADIGKNDLELMKKLVADGPVHAKYRRMITVYMDILAPLYWWKEFDTYKVGTVANSCSTMHKIAEKEFTIDDFSYEHLFSPLCFEPDDEDADECGIYISEMAPDQHTKYAVIDGGDKVDFFVYPEDMLEATVKMLNICRETYLRTKDKRFWWQLIQLLPSSYNQKRTVMLNYEVLANIYKYRKDHKLDEWREFCEMIEQLPHSDIITGGNNNE